MIAFIITWVIFIFYSFTREDLNLVLYKFIPPFLKNLGFYQRPIATLVFLILSSFFIVLYFQLIKQKLPSKLSWLKWAIPIALLGIFSYPMFSYDIFNYLFNAKMVLIYKANPHVQTAIQFSDPMLRFMRNIHTPAPYAYGWTAVSLIPGLAWLTQKFTLSFWIMKSFIACFWLGQLWILKKLVTKLFPKQALRWWLFALSPLVLTETLINGHNDVVMMFLSLFSFWYLLKSKKLFDRQHFIALLLLIISASIKYATIILLPLYFLKHLQCLSLKVKRIDIPTLASWILLAVMFIRPGQLHSWYLIWAFSFAILSKSRLNISIFTSLTLGALLRYAPFIYFGTWNPPVYLYRNLILLGSLILVPIIYNLLPASPPSGPASPLGGTPSTKK